MKQPLCWSTAGRVGRDEELSSCRWASAGVPLDHHSPPAEAAPGTPPFPPALTDAAVGTDVARRAVAGPRGALTPGSILALARLLAAGPVPALGALCTNRNNRTRAWQGESKARA